MNSTQIQENISSTTFNQNISYPMPFSRGAYVGFVTEWKREYALLSKAIHASKELYKECQRPAATLNAEQISKLSAQANYQAGPKTLGFVHATLPTGYAWMPSPTRLKATAHFMLTLRAKMKLEADASYHASHTVSGAPAENALSQSSSAESRS